MNENLNLEIVTPERVLLETKVDYVTIPGIVGELGILPGHIPLLTNLQSGILSYKNGNEESKIAIHYGYAEICQDKITILAKLAEFSNEIDIERAKASKQAAESELEQVMKDVDSVHKLVKLQQKIYRSITRQNVIS